ncbi:GNAT family N-acetyltransferase [Sediminibacillus albus]|uniref:Acetyltransferase (GNAT) family protein n=1 Tax=Sediminibacillus albus TaxID=407036 RepID=A0A1G9ASM4_9BACI|nr:GNAT family N-acetyltransferase [Sediminibacillus albus]SDK30267.1 Acetyltransferase (GNAT) family protein [Sediminibacillus albus]
MKISEITVPNHIPFELLLTADPNPLLVRQYLQQGRCYAAYDHTDLVGVYVLNRNSPQVNEIINIAVQPDYQNQGIGRKLINHAIVESEIQGCREVEIGTGNSSIGQLALYQKCGFRIKAVIKDFFTNNYPEEIIENGIVCRDMIRLSRSL